MDTKILEVTRLQSTQYHFRIKLQVTTFEGAHNPPYGIETITIVLDDKTRVTQFEHKNGSLKYLYPTPKQSTDYSLIHAQFFSPFLL